MPSNSNRTGACLCGAVKFEVTVPEPTFAICHCAMCRKWSSGPLMSAHCEGDIRFTEEKGMTWYRSSDWAERGFCGQCGTNLFWRLTDPKTPMLEISLEALDDIGDMTLECHVYSDAKPDRYDFKDDRPRITEAELLKELGMTPPD